MKQQVYKMPVDEMPNWQNAMFIKCQVDETASLQNASWWNAQLTKCQVDKIASLQNAKLMKCQIDKMPSW